MLLRVFITFSALVPLLLQCPVECGRSPSKVLELSDKFLEIKKEGLWLVKFYAPWCGYCKRLEPIFNHVAQALHDAEIRVGRVDCTRFPAVGKAFNIDGLPTIMLIKNGREHIYEGDRNTDDIVKYAKRLSGPAIKGLDKFPFQEVLNKHEIFFGYVGDKEDEIWNAFKEIAIDFQPHCDFFAFSTSQVPDSFIATDTTDSQIFVWKEGTVHLFQPPLTIPQDTELDSASEKNITLAVKEWVKKERFNKFMKITRGNFHHVLATKKFIALVVTEEDKLDRIEPEMEAFRDMVESVVHSHHDIYKDKFQFGWCGNPELANSIAMTDLPLPSLLVINSTSYQHHIPDDDSSELTPEAIVVFLDEVLNQTAKTYGGNSLAMRSYRAFFQSKKMLIDMWTGNWVLTTVVFGLPLGFLCLICYSIFFADILEGNEEEEPIHEKKE